MYIFTNGFWPGFNELIDGVHFGFFKFILEKVFNESIILTRNINEADILLETYFGDSIYFAKKWKYSIFFSAEASIPLPSHINKYSIVLGCPRTENNFVNCPAFIPYEFCKPFNYPSDICHIPPKNICSVISSSVDANKRFRHTFLNILEENNINVDRAGRLNNNVPQVTGNYFEQPIIDFYKNYKIVLALENTECDEYITEKIINALRAGSVPLYYGSKFVNKYINPRRFIQIDPNNIKNSIDEINKLCSDDNYWLSIVNEPIFIKPIELLINNIIDECKILISDKSYFTEIICNSEVETDRLPDLKHFFNFYNIRPTFEVWGEKNTEQHYLFKMFMPPPRLSCNMISASINHIAIMQKYANKQKFILIYESDVINEYKLDVIHDYIIQHINDMIEFDIDLIFLGFGCFPSGFPNINTFPKITNTLINTNTSRCVEAYLISPNGIKKYLNWFYSKNNHDIIDWDFNHFLKEVSNAKSCIRVPELFSQGSYTGKFKSQHM